MRRDLLVSCCGQVRVGDEQLRLAGGGGAGQRVAVRAGDQRAAHPVHAAFLPAAVGHRDEDPVGRGGRLRLDHLRRALAGRTRRGRPVHRGRDEIGAGQRGQPRPLGKLQVVADHQGHPAERKLHHRRRRVTGHEDQVLRVPQVRLAVDAFRTGSCHKRGAVVQPAIVAEFAEAAGDHQVVPLGELAPAGQSRVLVRARRGQASGLGLAGEHVA